MKDLTKGTLEYNEAVMKANDEAMKLIKTNSELAGSYTIQDGLITFDEEALKKAQEAELERLGKI
jgi:hypothetical protein